MVQPDDIDTKRITFDATSVLHIDQIDSDHSGLINKLSDEFKSRD